MRIDCAYAKKHIEGKRITINKKDKEESDKSEDGPAGATLVKQFIGK